MLRLNFFLGASLLSISSVSLAFEHMVVDHVSSDPLHFSSATIGPQKSNIGDQLSRTLSPQTSVILPGDVGFSNATARWDLRVMPGYQAYVEVAAETGIQKIVCLSPQSS